MSGVVALDHLQLAMPAGREAEARAFYGGILGLPEIGKPANLAVRGGVWFALGSQQLHLGVEGDFRPAKRRIRHSWCAISAACAHASNRRALSPTRTSRSPATSGVTSLIPSATG